MSGKHVFAGLVTAFLTGASVFSAVAARAEGPPGCESGCATLIRQLDGNRPFGVTSGPRGSMWFGIGNAVVRIDQQGQTTSYPASDPSERDVGWVTTVPDGDVWFCERDTGTVGRIDASGQMREYALPSLDAVPQGIVFAPDGNVYVTEQGSNALARLNPATGDVVDIPVPTPNSTTQSASSLRPCCSPSRAPRPPQRCPSTPRPPRRTAVPRTSCATPGRPAPTSRRNPPTQVTITRPAGFAWPEALMGAGAAALAIALVAGGVGLRRHGAVR